MIRKKIDMPRKSTIPCTTDGVEFGCVRVSVKLVVDDFNIKNTDTVSCLVRFPYWPTDIESFKIKYVYHNKHSAAA